MDVEQLGLETVPMWDAATAGESLANYTVALAPWGSDSSEDTGGAARLWSSFEKGPSQAAQALSMPQHHSSILRG